MIKAYENLANAIILQAVDDWRKAVRDLKRNPKYMPAKIMKEECEQFFLSGWFGILTSLDGEYLLNRLREEARQ